MSKYWCKIKEKLKLNKVHNYVTVTWLIYEHRNILVILLPIAKSTVWRQKLNILEFSVIEERMRIFSVLYRLNNYKYRPYETLINYSVFFSYCLLLKNDYI